MAAPSLLPLALITIAYAAITQFLILFAEPALMLIGAKFNSTLIFGAFFGANLGIPFAAVELAGLVVPGLAIHSHWMLALGVVAGLVVHVFFRRSVGGVVDKIERVEMLKLHTMDVTNEGVFRTVVQNGDLVRTGPFIISDVQSIHTAFATLDRACRAMRDTEFDKAEQLMLSAIPELKGCGLLGILRLQTGYRILEQSYAAADNRPGVLSCADRIRQLDLVYRAALASGPRKG